MKTKLVVLAALLLAACGAFPALATGVGLGQPTTAGPGSNVVMRLSVDTDGAPFESLDAVLAWDPARLRLLGIYRTPFSVANQLALTTSCGSSGGPCSAPSGSLDLALFSLADPPDITDGDQDLLWLEFEALAAGTSAVTFSEAFLNGDTAPGAVTNGSVTSSTDTPAFSLPHNASAPAGATTVAPLKVRPIGPWVSFDVVVEYLPAVVHVENVTLAPALSSPPPDGPFALTFNKDNVNGRLTISLYRATPSAGTAEDAIALIELKAVGSSGAESPLDITRATAAMTTDVDAVSLDDGRFRVEPDGDGDGWTVFEGDCDDANADRFPGHPEVVADGVDQDCAAGDLCRADGDLDGFGTAATIVSADLDCADPGESALATDCNDGVPAIFPGAPEIVADAVDQDCSGGDACFADGDGDTYGTTLATTVVSADLDCADAGESVNTLDCNDAVAAINPAAAELTADGVDQDCDGIESCFADADLDTYGTAALVNSADLDCTDAGESVFFTDCDDAAAAINPGALELCDGVDNDCDLALDDTGTRYVRTGGADGLSTCTAETPGCATIAHAIRVSCAGDVIDIGAGRFVENVRVPKRLTLHGAGRAVTTIVPAQSAPNPCSGSSMCGSPTAASNIVLVEASDVTVENLALDGDDTGQTSGVVVGGADLEARNGIIENVYAGVPFHRTTVRDVAVRNVYLRGVYMSSGGDGFVVENTSVHNARGEASSIAIMNWAGTGRFENNTVSACADGIVANHSRGTVFRGNHVSCEAPERLNGASGLHTDNAGDAAPNTADLLENNTVDGCGYGIFVFVPYVAPTVRGNVIQDTDVGLGAYGGAFPPAATATTPFTGNDVRAGAGTCQIGLDVSSTTFWWGATSVKIALDGNSLRGCTTGIEVGEHAADTTKDVELSGTGNTITQGGTGVHVATDVNGGVVNLDGNRIFDNTVAGFANDGTVAATAQCTWWGDPNGPSPAGTGNPVTTPLVVDYSPWAANAALTPVTLYADADGDTYGNPAAAISVCGPPYPAPYIVRGEDCDDARAATFPGAYEACNAIDDDCDAVIDGSDAYADCDDHVTCTTNVCVSDAGSARCDNTASSGACEVTALVQYNKVVAGVDQLDASKPVAGTVLLLTADTDLVAPAERSESRTTDAAGEAAFSSVNGNVVVAPQPRLETLEVLQNGVDSMDASLIAQHVVGLLTTPLSPNQRLAADASGNGTISSFDASLCVQLNLDLIPTDHLPKAVAVGSDWAYVPADVSYLPIGATASPAFTTFLWGDVDNNWFDAMAPAPPRRPAVAPPVPVTPSENAELYVVSGPRRVGVNRFEVTLGLAQADGIVAFDARLELADAVRVREVTTTGLADGFTVLTHAADGEQRIALYGATPMLGTGSFLVVTYELAGPATGMPFAFQAEANEGAIPLTFAPGLRPPAPRPAGGATGPILRLDLN